MALETVLQRTAQPDPDDRVTVDYEALWTLAQDCSDSGFGDGSIVSPGALTVPILTEPGSGGCGRKLQ
jgi:hypothetical protein